MVKVHISASQPYDVHLGRGILTELPDILGQVPGRGAPLLIVTDRNVARRYLAPLAGGLNNAGFDVRTAVFRNGEGLKSARPLFSLLETMVRHGLTRDSIVIALGGGVIGDFAGFGASVFMRGCGLVQVPTSLLAQVDSSVGGKTGINLREGKNLAGSFHNPLLVACDTDTLATLPAREVIGGAAEIVKYGLISDGHLFGRIEKKLREVGKRGERRLPPDALKTGLLEDRDFLDYLIRRSVEIKGEVVGADERESGLRMVLNFGHTFGHAVEQLTRYRRFLHGEAVLLGMKMATQLSADLGLLEPGVRDRVFGVLDLFGIPSVGRIGAAAIHSQMGRDKKKKGGSLHLVLLREIGTPEIVRDVDAGSVSRSIDQVIERETG